MMKKIVKVIGIVLFLVIIALVTAPYLFKDNIKNLIVNTLNKSVNAKVAIQDIDLSLFKNFPDANVTIEKLSIINKGLFEGDTLFYGEETNLTMKLTELFKDSSETMNLKSISLKEGNINIIVNKNNIGNYDIALKNEAIKNETSTTSSPFSLSFQSYQIENSTITYKDQLSGMKVTLRQLNHSGTGNFEKEKLDVTTNTSVFVSFQERQTTYMNNIQITLDAILGIDLKTMKFEFKNNMAMIHQLPLKFSGFVEMVDEGQFFDLKFQTPTSSFKNFLALLPETYTKDLKKIQTSGDFSVSGNTKGTLTATKIPTFDLKINAKNGMFKYDNLPESVNNISINTQIINKTGVLKDTYVDINKFSFSVHQEVFEATASIRNFDNPLVNAQLKGTINLDDISKAYPIALKTPLTGIIKADIQTQFDMNSIENERYENTQNKGNITLTNVTYSGPELAKPLQIQTAKIEFNPNNIVLRKFNSQTGGSDMQISGELKNFYGFIFKNQVLKGDFKMDSNNFFVSDFINTNKEDKKEGETTSTDSLKIPSFLDCTVTASAKNVTYDNLKLTSVSGNLLIKDEAVSLNQLKMSVFDGTIGMNGTISTLGKTPLFKMTLGMDKINIPTSFQELDLLKSIAPIANVVSGKLNANIKLSGNLTNDMTPDLNTLSGNVLGELINAKVDDKKSSLASMATSKFDFLDVSKLKLTDEKIKLNFKNGKVTVQPFDINYQDIKMTIGGTHGFDQNMHYDLKFELPPKYMGTEINSLIARLDARTQKNLKNIPVNGTITGNFESPSFSTDMKAAASNFTNQLIQQQKKKIVNQGIGQLSNALGLTSNKKKDSTKSINKTEDIIKNKLNNLFGKKKKKKN